MTDLKRSIRTFVMRTGRITPSQQKALQTLWPQYGLEANGEPLDFPQIFGRSAPVTLEIGFGMGDTLVSMARQAPERDFVGVEVHLPGVGRTLAQIAEQGLTNLRIMREDALDILRQQIPDASLDRIQVFFPDPWHKKKHHKRRLIQPDNIALFAQKQAAGGWLHLATDWQPYAEQMIEVMTQRTDYSKVPGFDTSRPEFRPETRFEQRGHRLGHPVADLIYERTATA
jgi:tRNA (guanine-N7-)-methyltransferase